MRGTIISYDLVSSTGVIKGEDGESYVFSSHDVHTGNEIREELVVDFLAEGSAARKIVIFMSVEDTDATFAAAAAATVAAHDQYDFKTAMLSFQGRLRRKFFWISIAILFVANLIAGFIPILGSLIGLALIWPGVAVIVKRLHDMGLTGWYTFVPYVGSALAIVIAFIGGGGAVLSSTFTGDQITPAAVSAAAVSFIIAGLVYLISNIGFLIWIGVTDSKPGTNDYGPNPKGL